MSTFTAGRIERLVAIGAHSDDIEIGCGATLRAIADAHPECRMVWVVLTGDAERQWEARESAEAMFPGRPPTMVFGGMRDGHLPYAHATEAKELVHRVRDEHGADLVFTHHRADMHQDHRLCGDLAHQAFRGVAVLEYEIPKWDGDLTTPNLLVPVSPDAARGKVDHLMRHFASQRGKGWFTPDLFIGLMRLRGVEAAAASGFAEGFHARKLVWAP
ncbi:MAG: PIG-L deacetylase family protein [Thermoleophilia bacterium]